MVKWSNDHVRRKRIAEKLQSLCSIAEHISRSDILLEKL